MALISDPRFPDGRDVRELLVNLKIMGIPHRITTHAQTYMVTYGCNYNSNVFARILVPYRDTTVFPKVDGKNGIGVVEVVIPYSQIIDIVTFAFNIADYDGVDPGTFKTLRLRTIEESTDGNPNVTIKSDSILQATGYVVDRTNSENATQHDWPPPPPPRPPRP